MAMDGATAALTRESVEGTRRAAPTVVDYCSRRPRPPPVIRNEMAHHELITFIMNGSHCQTRVCGPPLEPLLAASQRLSLSLALSLLALDPRLRLHQVLSQACP